MVRAAYLGLLVLLGVVLSNTGTVWGSDSPPKAEQSREARPPETTELGRLKTQVDFAFPTYPYPLITFVQSGLSDELGAALTPAEDSLRVQLGLGDGQGLVVSNVQPGGAADRVGLKANDILLSLGGHPLREPVDLGSRLKAAGEGPVDLRLLRAGKGMTLRVRPIYRVTLGAAAPEKRDYYIGVPVQPPDDTLRAHLVGLPPGQGLVVTDVQEGSPAARAGLRRFDVLLEFAGKPLRGPGDLVAGIQASGGKRTPLKLLRGGKERTVEVTPELRAVPAEGPPHGSVQADTYRQFLFRWPQPDLMTNVRSFPPPTPDWTWTYELTKPEPAMRPDPSRIAGRLKELQAEVEALRRSIDELRDNLKRE